MARSLVTLPRLKRNKIHSSLVAGQLGGCGASGEGGACRGRYLKWISSGFTAAPTAGATLNWALSFSLAAIA